MSSTMADGDVDLAADAVDEVGDAYSAPEDAVDASSAAEEAEASRDTPEAAETSAAPAAICGRGLGPPLQVEEEDCGDPVIRQHLYDAVRDGSATKAAEALDRGAGINAQDPWGLAPLHSSAVGGHAEVCSLLLSRRAAVDRMSQAGKTALHFAVSTGHAAVAQLLLSQGGADAMLSTAHGNVTLELAREHLPGGPCEQIIRADLTRRLNEADHFEEELRRRLTSSDSLSRRLRVQLGVEEEADDFEALLRAQSASDATGAATRGGGRKATEKLMERGYWPYFAQSVTNLCMQAEKSLTFGVIREPPAGDSSTWFGQLESRMPLPKLDRDDQVINESYRNLNFALEDYIKRHRKEHAATEVAQHPERNEVLREKTGRGLVEWEELVLRLRAPDATWDWSHLEVRKEERPGAPRGCKSEACFVRRGGDEPVFRRHEVVGPLGGTLHRRARYESLYYPRRKLVLFDPSCYQFSLRAKTPALELEPLILDLTADPSNRLRYLADARPDPLSLRQLEEGKLPDGVFSVPELELPLRRYGAAFPRVRSRPSSPHHGDGGEAAAAEVEARVKAEEEARRLLWNGSAQEEASYRDMVDTATNVQIVEVLVRNWPYAFVVATRDIMPGERLAVDRGEDFWAVERAALARIHSMARIGRDLVVGVDAVQRTGDEAPPAEEGVQCLERPPMTRIKR